MKILIVDDEVYTRRGIQKHVNWSKLGIDVIEEASDAEDAMKKAQVLQPDIILSDVRMPGLNGIELCQKLREKNSEAQIIFLSGFSDKEYLKAAIELSAVSYVEKPVDINELEIILKKAVQRCLVLNSRKKQKEEVSIMFKNNQKYIKNRIMLALIAGDESAELEKDMEVAKFFQDYNAYYLVAVLKVKRPEKYWQNSKSELLSSLEERFASLERLIAYKDDRHIVIILSGKNLRLLDPEGPLINNFCTDILQGSFFKDDLFCGFGRVVKGIINIPNSYQESVFALQKLFYYGYNCVELYKKSINQTLMTNEPLHDSFVTCLKEKNEKAAEETINHLYRYYKYQNNVLVNHVKHVYFQLNSLVMTYIQSLREFLKLEINGESFLWEEVNSFDTLLELSDYLRVNTRIYFGYFQMGQGTGMTIMNIVNQINENYAKEDLSVKWLAQKVYLTSTYLSQLFKKEVGKTISQYITEVRIEHSKELLKNKQFKLYDIAEKVGYADANYYAKTFKKLVGITPSEYREKNL